MVEHVIRIKIGIMIDVSVSEKSERTCMQKNIIFGILLHMLVKMVRFNKFY